MHEASLLWVAVTAVGSVQEMCLVQHCCRHYTHITVTCCYQLIQYLEVIDAISTAAYDSI